MSTKQPKISLLRSIGEIIGIAFMRFRPIQRIWVIWLVAANAAAVLFIDHLEAQIALGAVGAAVLAQALIYQRNGFVRILGTTHILWVPMLVWMVTRVPATVGSDPGFRAWLIVLIATNLVSLAIDAWDATRFVLGERSPYYVW